MAAAFARSVTTQSDLVVFNARTIQSQNADVADMVVATCIDAAGNFDFQGTDVVLDLHLVDAGRDLLGNRD